MLYLILTFDELIKNEIVWIEIYYVSDFQIQSSRYHASISISINAMNKYFERKSSWK